MLPCLATLCQVCQDRRPWHASAPRLSIWDAFLFLCRTVAQAILTLAVAATGHGRRAPELVDGSGLRSASHDPERRAAPVRRGGAHDGRRRAVGTAYGVAWRGTAAGRSGVHVRSSVGKSSKRAPTMTVNTTCQGAPDLGRLFHFWQFYLEGSESALSGSSRSTSELPSSNPSGSRTFPVACSRRVGGTPASPGSASWNAGGRGDQRRWPPSKPRAPMHERRLRQLLLAPLDLATELDLAKRGVGTRFVTTKSGRPVGQVDSIAHGLPHQRVYLLGHLQIRRRDGVLLRDHLGALGGDQRIDARLPAGPRTEPRVRSHLERIVGADARRLARGRLQVDDAPGDIQQVHEAPHSHAADDALYRAFERGRLYLRRHFVEVFPCEHGGLALEQIDIFVSPEGGLCSRGVPGLFEGRLQIVGIGRAAVQLGAEEGLGHLMHDAPTNQRAVGRVGQSECVFVVPLGTAVPKRADLRGREHRAQVVQRRRLRRSRGDYPRLRLDREARQHARLLAWRG